ncbi:MAG: glycosyltransferase family 39 protein [Planctomycetes bacterium]|nr:glycosyltransferase family 39 protein [Planctomycetota bacterium]
MPDPTPPPAPPAEPRPGPTLAALVVLGFALRLGFALLKSVVSTDAYWYVRMAKMMLHGDWTRALDHGYHPAFPALTALAALVLRDVPTAAYAVTITLGALSVLPAWFIGHRLGGSRAAIFAALLVAVHPESVDDGSDILVEATYVFFFLGGLACALRAIATTDLRAAALSGLCAGLAYLTRPEGIALPALAVPALLAAGLPRFCPSALPHWPRRAACAALLSLTFLACLLPYVLWAHHHLGRWTLTPKAGGEAFTSGTKAPEGESQSTLHEKAARNPLVLPWVLTRKFSETIYLGFLPLLVAAFLIRGSRGPDARLARLAILVLLAIYMPPLVRLLYVKGYISTRHLLMPALLVVLLLAPVAAALSLRWKRGLPVLVLLIAAVALPKSLRRVRTEQVALKEAGEWLKEKAPGAEFMGPEKPAFYADVFFYKVPAGGRPGDIATAMRDKNIRWLVLLEDDQPGVASRLDWNFQKSVEFGSGSSVVRIYHLLE